MDTIRTTLTAIALVASLAAMASADSYRTAGPLLMPAPAQLVALPATEVFPVYAGPIANAYEAAFVYSPQRAGSVQFAGSGLPRDCYIRHGSRTLANGDRLFRLIAFCLFAPDLTAQPGLSPVIAMIYYTPLSAGKVGTVRTTACSALGDAGSVCDTVRRDVFNVE